MLRHSVCFRVSWSVVEYFIHKNGAADNREQITGVVIVMVMMIVLTIVVPGRRMVVRRPVVPIVVRGTNVMVVIIFVSLDPGPVVVPAAKAMIAMVITMAVVRRVMIPARAPVAVFVARKSGGRNQGKQGNSST